MSILTLTSLSLSVRVMFSPCQVSQIIDVTDDGDDFWSGGWSGWGGLLNEEKNLRGRRALAPPPK